MTEENRLALSANELRAKLGICKSSLARLVKTKRLCPLACFKRHRLFSMADVEKFLADKK
jgi:hypothetical protein